MQNESLLEFDEEFLWVLEDVLPPVAEAGDSGSVQHSVVTSEADVDLAVTVRLPLFAFGHRTEFCLREPLI